MRKLTTQGDTTGGALLFLLVVVVFIGFGIFIGWCVWGGTLTIKTACLSFHHVTSGISQVIRIAGHVYSNMRAKACGAG